ncbi:MAG: cell cycle transcriptional regulator TrcR [Pseudomonadota bacterium]
MSKQPLMPTATAVWLVDNTTLTFRQIATFCGLHPLEVQGIADGTVAIRMVGHDPIKNAQLTAEEIKRCEDDESADLELLDNAVPTQKRAKGPRYTPVSKRKNKPDAISWLVRNHPELSDGQIGRLIGTTKPTIESVRSKTHWDMANIRPQDPVGLGMCTQVDLDAAVAKAAKARPDLVIKNEQPEAPPQPAENEFSATEKLGSLLSGDRSSDETLRPEDLFPSDKS